MNSKITSKHLNQVLVLNTLRGWFVSSLIVGLSAWAGIVALEASASNLLLVSMFSASMGFSAAALMEWQASRPSAS